jgi:hypothetical protein
MIVTGPFITVVTGTAVYVLGQMFSKFLIDPVHELRQKVLQTRDDLSFHANIYSNWGTPGGLPVEKVRATSETLRQASVRLSAAVGAVVFYNLWVRARLLPSQEVIRSAARDLIYLSNSHGLGGGEYAAINAASQRIETTLVL